MTNDDRSNDDRTNDGRTPSWGEAPQQSASPDDRPRYGERVDPASAPAPQYGSQEGGEHGAQHGTQHGAPSWGDQQHAQQSHQPYAAAPASAGAPAWQSYDQPSAKAQKKRKTVGVVALVVALLALVLGVISGVVFGHAVAGNAQLREMLANGGTAAAQNQQELQRTLEDDPAFMASVGGGSVAVVIASLLGVWAIIQGIIAIISKRGRAFGVLALVLAIVAPVAFFIALTVSATAGS